MEPGGRELCWTEVTVPGRFEEACETMAPRPTKILTAEDGENGQSVAYIGTGGAGHFVRWSLSGVEYGIASSSPSVITS